ncbi:unnamed protein product [Adineta steineri]|uniref:Uncharacterized protein n=1 Tax=Adineta steineri TaxID=433720 RepID=A0A819PZX7_9BILA|nr:unnamed protein product [Adineta steineri]CAF4023506.1 unnamed protein product [Adineta steineri]
MSQQSSIIVNTYHGLVLSPILDQFSIKSGHKLYNKTCRSSTNCTFDDRFNRSLVIEHIQIELIEKNYSNYRIRIQHALSYNIQILSLWNIGLPVQKQFDIPRKETNVDINVYSTISIFETNIKIQGCNINDSPFLSLCTRLMTNFVLMNGAFCEPIDDDTTLIINRYKHFID